ncbi:hypothetical protein H1R20_g16559, partial [Candolleomyces eurysporus]
MKFSQIITALLAAAASSSFCLAAPVPNTQDASQAMVVVNPHITAPQQNEFWAKGSKHVVRWDTDKIPQGEHAAPLKGLVVLGYSTPDSDDEHLDLDHPLASGFSLSDGSVEVEIPSDAASRKDYFIVLFGDSGNVSPNFTIDEA